MTLFELENGRLVPAQFGRDVPEGFTPEVLGAIRAQVLDIVARPLFPITWSHMGRRDFDAQGSRLTALDASGQVVSVEVTRELDSDRLIDSLSKLADAASLSWESLAARYALGPDNFKREWVQFREAMPPSPPNGPRLVIVASSISDDVRPALDVLSASGVEVHQMSLRQMGNGRAFLDVEVVGPRHYSHRPSHLVEMSTVLPALSEKAPEDVERLGLEAPAPSRRSQGERGAGEHVASAPLATPPAASSPRSRTPNLPSRVGRSNVSTSSATQRVFPSRRDANRGAMPRRTRAAQQRSSTVPTGQEAAQALSRIARAAGGDLPLYSAGRPGQEAVLTVSGLIRVPAGSYPDPTVALRASGVWGAEGWSTWRVASPTGPTLLEALSEV